ncbi:hypothetical protein C5Q97_14765 [Victivallales bacterium CCUG 44730]|nr:hypothetical protein C5Q97_14765 [Victivallales bacterium CCUG 44730]
MINWDDIPVDLKKYKDKINSKHSFFMQFHMQNLQWLDSMSAQTNSYQQYANGMNEIQMLINTFENFVQLEDIRFEHNGIGDFIIDMPLVYFRFPYKNNIRSPWDYCELSEEEASRISNIKSILKEKQRSRNDETFLREGLSKLELFSMFSLLEGFLQNYIVERKIDIPTKNSKYSDELNANNFIQHRSLADSLKYVLSHDKRTLFLADKLNPDWWDLFYFAYELRNLHTHNGGIVTNYMIENLKRKGVIKKNINSKGVEYEYIACIPGDERVPVVGKYWSITLITALFRSYSNEFTFILDRII